MAPLADFIRRWTGTTASPLQLVDSLMSSDYLTTFFPVVSSRNLGHITFVVRNGRIVGGQRVVCPSGHEDRMDIGRNKKQGQNTTYKVTCRTCMKYTTLKVKENGADAEGESDPCYRSFRGCRVVQTSFPVPHKNCIWHMLQSSETHAKSCRPAKRARTCESLCPQVMPDC